MADTFERIRRLRRRLKQLDDDDLRVLDNATSRLAAAVDRSEDAGIFVEDDANVEMLVSAQRAIEDALADKDIESVREEFWNRARMLGFGREDEHWDYRDASPPPEMLRRLIEQDASIAYQCVSIMAADGLVKAWIDRGEFRDGFETPEKHREPGIFYAAEQHILRVSAKEEGADAVDIADWHLIAQCRLNKDGEVEVTNIEWPVEIEGVRCHRISGTVEHVLKKLKLEDLDGPLVAPNVAKLALLGQGKQGGDGGPYR